MGITKQNNVTSTCIYFMLYSTVGSPFDSPATGKIAVKVINHYGDEVLKVYEAGK